MTEPTMAATLPKITVPLLPILKAKNETMIAVTTAAKSYDATIIGMT